MSRIKSTFLVCMACASVVACSTARHGTFVTNSYIDKPEKLEAAKLGRVRGQSSQLWVLYIFPMGGAPSTNEAMLAAKQQLEDTAFLADISIDDRVIWGFGYRTQTISVEGDAYR